MTIAISLAGLIWVWFQVGLHAAMIVIVGIVAVLLCMPGQRSSALVLLVFAGAVIMSLEAQMRHPMAAHYQHQTFPLTLCIDQVPRQYSDGTQSARASVLHQPSELNLRNVRFWLYPETIEQSLSAGDCLQGDVRLRQPLGRLIPGTFNADRYNFAEKIDAYGTVQSISYIENRANLQQRIYLNGASKLGEGVGLDVWSALALGWSRAMAPETKSILADNQLMHLFVISGMHLAFVVAMISYLIRGIAWLGSFRFQISRAQRFFLTGVFTLSYVAFLGWPLPVTRALLMLCLPMLANLLAVQTGRLTILGWSAAMLMIWHPAAWLSPGPWLSFVSVAIILMIFDWRLIQRFHRLWQPFAFQGLMTLSILPWALVGGFSLNLVSILSCLVLTGLVGFIGLPVALMIPMVDVPWLFQGWNQAVHSVISVLTVTADWGGKLPFLSVWLLVPGLILVVWTIWRRGFQAVLVLLAMGLSMTCHALFYDQPKFPSLTVFDVGHGQALLIRDREASVLYDTGGQFSPEISLFEASLNRVLPDLDGVVVSHSDTDHAAGAGFLRGEYPWLPIWSGQADRLPASYSVQSCESASRISPSIRVIPVPESLRRRHDNNQSCVIAVEVNGHRILITGDADKFIEYYLLQTYPELFPFDVVLLGHHGSDSSSAKAFLQANQSALFVVSSGDRLAPRWPALRIERWFSEQNKALFNTAQSGTIRLSFNQEGLTVKTWDSAYRNRLIY